MREFTNEEMIPGEWIVEECRTGGGSPNNGWPNRFVDVPWTSGGAAGTFRFAPDWLPPSGALASRRFKCFDGTAARENKAK